jgi:hypothetical protein
MASHARKLWTGGILLALGGTAAAAVSADSPTATEKASGTAPVEVRTEVVRKTVHKKARAAAAGNRGPSGSRGRDHAEDRSGPAPAAPARSAAAPAAPFVSRAGDDDGDHRGRGRGRGGDDDGADDHGGDDHGGSGRDHAEDGEHHSGDHD